jgi:hypothetical protein
MNFYLMMTYVIHVGLLLRSRYSGTVSVLSRVPRKGASLPVCHRILIEYSVENYLSTWMLWSSICSSTCSVSRTCYETLFYKLADWIFQSILVSNTKKQRSTLTCFSIQNFLWHTSSRLSETEHILLMVFFLLTFLDIRSFLWEKMKNYPVTK